MNPFSAFPGPLIIPRRVPASCFLGLRRLAKALSRDGVDLSLGLFSSRCLRYMVLFWCLGWSVEGGRTLFSRKMRGAGRDIWFRTNSWFAASGWDWVLTGTRELPLQSWLTLITSAWRPWGLKSWLFAQLRKIPDLSVKIRINIYSKTWSARKYSCGDIYVQLLTGDNGKEPLKIPPVKEWKWRDSWSFLLQRLDLGRQHLQRRESEDPGI